MDIFKLRTRLNTKNLDCSAITFNIECYYINNSNVECAINTNNYIIRYRKIENESSSSSESFDDYSYVETAQATSTLDVYSFSQGYYSFSCKAISDGTSIFEDSNYSADITVPIKIPASASTDSTLAYQLPAQAIIAFSQDLSTVQRYDLEYYYKANNEIVESSRVVISNILSPYVIPTRLNNNETYYYTITAVAKSGCSSGNSTLNGTFNTVNTANPVLDVGVTGKTRTSFKLQIVGPQNADDRARPIYISYWKAGAINPTIIHREIIEPHYTQPSETSNYIYISDDLPVDTDSKYNGEVYIKGNIGNDQLDASSVTDSAPFTFEASPTILIKPKILLTTKQGGGSQHTTISISAQRPEGYLGEMPNTFNVQYVLAETGTPVFGNNTTDVTYNNSTTIPGNTNIELTNLNSGTRYGLRAKFAEINGDNITVNYDWTDADLTFITPTILEPPTDVVINDSYITANTATVSYNVPDEAAAVSVRYIETDNIDNETAWNYLSNKEVENFIIDSISLPGLIANTAYSVQLKSIGQDIGSVNYGTSSWSPSYTFITKISAPAITDLDTSQITDSTITIEFQQNTEYDLEYELRYASTTTAVEDLNWITQNIPSGSTTGALITATVSNLAANTYYSFQVRSKANETYNLEASPWPITIHQISTLKSLVPPGTFTTYNIQASSVALRWNSSANASAYQIKYFKTNEPENFIWSSYITNESTTITGLNEETPYTFHLYSIVAYQNDDNSSSSSSNYTVRYSNEFAQATATTLKKLDNVTGITLSHNSATNVTLTFNRVLNADKYLVYFYTGAKEVYWSVEDDGSETYSKTFAGLSQQTTYHYGVIAVPIEGSSAYGISTLSTLTDVTGKKLPRPTNVGATSGLTSSEVILSFESINDTDIKAYSIYIRKGLDTAIAYTYTLPIAHSIDETVIYKLTLPTNLDNAENLTNLFTQNSRYYFQLQATGNPSETKIFNSDKTDAVTCKTSAKLNTPAKPELVDKTNSSVRLRYSYVPDAISYKVRYKLTSSSTYLEADNYEIKDTISGLVAGEYEFSIQAKETEVYDASDFSEALVVTIPLALAQPPAPTLVVVDSKTLNVAFTPEDDLNYVVELYRITDGNHVIVNSFMYYAEQTDSSGSSSSSDLFQRDITNLSQNTTYYATIQAYKDGASPVSDPTSATTKRVLTQPSVVITSKSATVINFGISGDETAGATFSVKYGTTPALSSTATTTMSSSSEFLVEGTLTGLAGNTTYYIQSQYIPAASNLATQEASPYSELVSTTTKTALETPNFTVEALDAASIRVNVDSDYAWSVCNISNTNAGSFSSLVTTNPGKIYPTFGTYYPSYSSLIFYNLTDGTTYYISSRAKPTSTNELISDASDTQAVTLENALNNPSGLTVSNILDKTALIAFTPASYTAVEGRSAQYILQYVAESLRTESTLAAEFTEVALKEGSTLGVRVYPENSSVTYTWSRCTTNAGTFINISGATNSTYSLTGNDINNYIRCTVTNTLNNDQKITLTSDKAVASRGTYISRQDGTRFDSGTTVINFQNNTILPGLKSGANYRFRLRLEEYDPITKHKKSSNWLVSDTIATKIRLMRPQNITKTKVDSSWIISFDVPYLCQSCLLEYSIINDFTGAASIIISNLAGKKQHQETISNISADELYIRIKSNFIDDTYCDSYWAGDVEDATNNAPILFNAVGIIDGVQLEHTGVIENGVEIDNYVIKYSEA